MDGTARMNDVLVALGSNLGDSPRILREAMERLQALAAMSLRRSSLWGSAPVDCPPGSPPFVNAAVAMEPRLGETPESLLVKLQSLEREFGRQPKVMLNEPRPLDLDLIAYGDARRSASALVLPHPRAHLRRFVLEPLNEVAPDAMLPGQNLSIRELLARLETRETVQRLDEAGRP